jgi:hypothetical protein
VINLTAVTAELAPPDWSGLTAEKPRLEAFTDISIYELHVRDFRCESRTFGCEFRALLGEFMTFRGGFRAFWGELLYLPSLCTQYNQGSLGGVKQYRSE